MEKPINPQKQKARLADWKKWVSAFKKATPSAQPITNAAELLNIYYWQLAAKFIKPFLGDADHNLHYYKIISASELAVMAVLPFRHKSGPATDDDDDKERELNAEFAWFVGLAILLNWKIDGNDVLNTSILDKLLDTAEPIDVLNGETRYYPLNFADEHIGWLKDLNTAGPLPVLSNSQTWRLLFLGAQLDKL